MLHEGPDIPLRKYSFEKNCRCIKSGTSEVYVDKNKGMIIKYFGNNFSSLKKQNISNEKDALIFCHQYLGEASKHIPKLIEHCADYFVLEYKGEDAIDMINRDVLNTKIFVTFLADIAFVLSTLHDKGRTHGDIKLENVCWDGEKWNLIDFGFSYRIDTPLKRRQKHGTFPFIFPGYGNKEMLESFYVNNKNVSVRVVADWYAFALTALIFVGFDYYESDDRSIIKYDINDIIFFYEKAKLNREYDDVLSALAGIVLSVIDADMHTLQWCKRSGTCKYIGGKVRDFPVNKDTCACINIYMDKIKKMYE